MNAREAQNILLQEVARRQAAEVLIQALEVAAQAEELASAAQKRVVEWDAKELKAKGQASAALDAAKAAAAQAAQAEAERDARVQKARADVAHQLAQFEASLKAKLILLQGEYNEKQLNLLTTEESNKAVFDENQRALDNRLKELHDQVNAEEIRLETIRKLRADLQKA